MGQYWRSFFFIFYGKGIGYFINGIGYFIYSGFLQEGYDLNKKDIKKLFAMGM
jgi:hypothetical protein